MSVNITVLVAAGSNNEVKAKNGIAHFLEHMTFKGTTKRPTSISISRDLDEIGSQYNAFTSHEYTGYYVTCLSEKFETALEIIADMFQNPLLDQAEMDKERGVIIEEINMSEDDPQSKVGDVFRELIYGDQPAGWDIAGTKKTLPDIKRQDFLAFRKKYYTAETTMIVVSGQITEKSALEKLEKYFHNLPKGGLKKLIKAKEKQTAPASSFYFKKSDQTHLVLGFRSFGLLHKDLFTAYVLARVLGGGMSSRLFQRVREELGAAYYISAYNANFVNYGYLGISAGVDNSRLAEVIKAIAGECRKLKEELVPAKELATVKNGIIGNLHLSLETSADLANFYGFQELLEGKMLSPLEIKERITQISAEEVRALAKKIFVDSNMNLAAVGPNKDSAPFVKEITL